MIVEAVCRSQLKRSDNGGARLAFDFLPPLGDYPYSPVKQRAPDLVRQVVDSMMIHNTSTQMCHRHERKLN